MLWNWQLSDWPSFRWETSLLAQAEQEFLVGGGVILGAVDHLPDEESAQIQVELMSGGALDTSEIEGETLDRVSVQSSIRQRLGLDTDDRRVGPSEQGIAEMTVAVHRTFAEPLTERVLCSWHEMVTNGRRDLRDVGRYRTHSSPMQVVSGRLDQPRVHFEAPPSAQVPSEMAQFLDWFNRAAGSDEPLPALTRAGLAHLYFVSIHPFEDGNGRLGRAVTEKVLAQGMGRATLLALSSTILARRTEYYTALEAASQSNDVTNWLAWFGGVVLEAQGRTLSQVEFIIDKARLLDRHRGALNGRQEKALLRMFREGPGGFAGGLSAKNYVSITGATSATTTRDLGDLVEKGALVREGERKATRYRLALPRRPVRSVRINERGEVVEE